MRTRSLRLVLSLVGLLVLVAGAVPASANDTAQSLPFSQNWTNTGLITVSDDWSGVPGVIGYRGDGLATTGADPQTVTSEGTPVIDVNANQTNPSTFITGGVSEFEIANPVVALQGSGTADAPSIVLSVNTTGQASVVVAYNLRDIDGAADDAVQQVALQYRVGSTGSYTNLPAGYVADATTGPSLATLVTPVSVTLPAAADNQPVVQIRVITADAAGSDEWVGVDDISVTAGGTPGDAAPSVASTTPSSGASGVPTTSNVDITFSEPVTASAAAFSIVCATSGAHAFALSGGPTTYTINPATDFVSGESCMVTVDDAGVSDVDVDDPPDNMAADHVFSFTAVPASARIYDIQGASHTSPFAGRLVAGVPGVITAVRPSSFYMQDATGDSIDATSDAILVFVGGSTEELEAGQAVLVDGRVTEFRPGGASSTNLTTTEIISPTVTPAGLADAIAPTVVGVGGRVPPATVIEDDATGDVETSGVFDPDSDGIDFYESMEAMLVQVNDAVVTGPRSQFGEVWVVGDGGAGAGLLTTRGGIVIRANDFNPERIQLDDEIISPATTPAVNVGDEFTTAPKGVLEYNFGNFEILLTSALTRVDNGLTREVTPVAKKDILTVATFNVENLDPGDGAAKFAQLAGLIVDNLRSPAIIAVEEVQDNNGATNDGTTDASLTYQTLITAIQAAGGPLYDFRDIPPVNNEDGGEPGGNIRVGFLFRTDVTGLSFRDRPGATPTTSNAVVPVGDGVRLVYSPGRIDPTNAAFNNSRKPLAGEFLYRNRRLILIANHFNSKGGDQPLFGRFQPPARSSEVQRHQQAQIVNDFVDQILAVDAKANIVVLGDLNDFEFSTTVDLVEGGVLTTLLETLPGPERYSYVFEGNSQSLDQVLVSRELAKHKPGFDAVHVNAEFADQASDHDPQVAWLEVQGRDVPLGEQ